MKTQCPHCNVFFDVDDDCANRHATCTTCGREFVVRNINAVVAENKGNVDAPCRPAPPPLPEGIFSVSNVIAGFLVAVAVIVALFGIAGFNDPMARSAIHQIFFAMRTVAHLAGSIIILLIAILIKMK